jgi:predicted membrane-bound spermidine synthase
MNLAFAGKTKRASTRVLAAVFMLSASGLIFELTLTRIFSATIWYHYTFVAISVALFGWGLGGFLVYLFQLGRIGRHVQPVLVLLSCLLAVSLPLFPWGILQFPFTPERLNFYFAIGLLPFVTGGAALSLAFEEYGADSNRLYFADLIGAAAGTLMVPLVISALGAETAIMAAALLPAVAAILLSMGRGGTARQASRVLACIVLIGVVCLTGWNIKTQTLTIRDAPEKALYKLLREQPQARIASDRWNAYSRITSVVNFDEYHLARLFIDSDAETSILRWDGRPESIPNARDWFRAFPFRLADQPRVLVIGPGGGTDVIMAICNGSPLVTAVEMNPLIVDAVNHWGERVGNLYQHPKVKLVMDEGRNFIQRTDEKFDLIVLGFVDSWASVSSGGLSLTENYLYTQDALAAYYDHLTDRGTLAIVRWPSDVPRLVANSVSFLSQRGMGMEQIGKRLLAVSQWQQKGNKPVETVFMLTKSPLTAETVDALLAGHSTAHVICAADRQCTSPYDKLLSGQMSFADYQNAFTQLATPVNDNHPFYFATDKPYGIPEFVTYLFRLPILAVVGFAVLLIVGSWLVGFRAPGPRTVAYFGSLGIGFIVCEIALMQKLILLLGHPIYTLVVILFTLLLASALGSLFAREVTLEHIRRVLGIIIPAIIAFVVLAAFLLSPLVQVLLFLPLFLRIAAAAIIVFPFGFCMGMPFPLGLRQSAQRTDGVPVSALWGINGVASVIGSIGAAVLAVAAGFTVVFLAGAACYAVAWVARPK